MNPVTDRPLYDAMVLALEGLSFLLVDDEFDDDLAGPGSYTRAEICFEGPLKGRLWVTVGDDLLETISANMLGEDVAPGGATQYDALGEVANVIAGNYLPMVGGQDAVFHISPPVVQGVSSVAACDQAGSCVCAQFLEGGACASVQWDSAPPALGCAA